jgi:hypothetical protein
LHHLTSAHFFIQSPRMTASVLRGAALFASRSRKAPMHWAQFPTGFHAPVTPQAYTIWPELMDIAAHISGMFTRTATGAYNSGRFRICLVTTWALARLQFLPASVPLLRVVLLTVCRPMKVCPHGILFDAIFTAHIVSKRGMLAARCTDAIPPALIPPRLGSFRIVTAHRSSSS